MGKRRSDGSVQSSNLPDSRFFKVAQTKDFGIYRCMVVKVHYVGDSENYTNQNQQVTYSAIIVGGKNEGQEISNIKSISSFGGQYNYSEKIYRSVNYRSQGLSNKAFSEQEGDIIFVAYIQGDPTLPIIIGGGTQVLDLDSTGATREDGNLFREEYNGIYKFINKDGELTLTRKGGVYQTAEDYFLPQDKANKDPSLFEARMRWFKNTMIWEDPQNSLEFLKTEKKATLSVGESAVKEVWDGKNEIKTITLESGLEITYDGKNDKVQITLASGDQFVIDGQTNKAEITLSTGDVFTVDGLTSKITLSSGFVDLGKSVADLAVLFSQLAGAYNAHTHPVVLTGSGYIALQTAPLLPSVASTTVKLQP